LQHVILERWSRGSSFLHQRDARVKILALLIFLVAVATTHGNFEAPGICYLATLVAGVIAARLPMAGVLRRAAVVLPFSFTFAAVSWLSGEPRRAALLIEKSYLSALAALLLVATTPLPQLLRGLEMLGAPGFLLMVAQFLYRYLFVIVEQAVAPIQRGSQGPLSRRRSAAAAHREIDAVIETREKLVDSECPHSSSRQLDCQGQPVQAAANGSDGWSVLVDGEIRHRRLRALDEELDCRGAKQVARRGAVIGHGERWHTPHHLALNP